MMGVHMIKEWECMWVNVKGMHVRMLEMQWDSRHKGSLVMNVVDLMEEQVHVLN